MSIPPVNHSRRLDYTISVPSNLSNAGSSFTPTQSTVLFRSLQPQVELHVARNFGDVISDSWQAIINFFKSLFSCFGLFATAESSTISIPPSERENRLTKDEAAIHRSLGEQMRRNAEQMAHEPAKSFRYLDAPVSWHSHEERVGNYQVGIAHAQGLRPTMEDEHLAVSFDLTIQGRRYPVQLFGIFDGHGGPMAARFVRDNLQRKLQETLIEFNPNGLTEAGIWRALKMASIRLNHDFKNSHGQIARDQGTTATIAMILDGNLWTANVGDARTVLDNNGIPVQLTEDAKPHDPRYRRGIEHRGGNVVGIFGVPRVNGDLAVARAIGDHRLNGAISARSKIARIPMSQVQPGSHLILCCDGIYDVSRTADVVAGAHAHQSRTAGTLAKDIIYSAYQAGSTDNLSALVVKLV